VTCRRIEESFALYAAAAAIPPEAAAHIAGCVSCRRMLAAMRQWDAPEPPSPERLRQIQAQLRANLQPVRPLPPARVFVLGLLLIAAVAVAIGAAHLGIAGWEALGPLRRTAVFATLAAGLGLLSVLLTREIVPGSHVLLDSRVAVTGVFAILAAIFALLFDFHAEPTFVATGLVCLAIGIECAVPVAAFSWLILRKGMVLRPTAAGALTGLLAGLSGLTLLEIFCPNPDKYHVLVWHIGAALVSTIAGAAIGWIADTLLTRNSIPPPTDE
jgi:hypothetical protein